MMVALLSFTGPMMCDLSISSIDNFGLMLSLSLHNLTTTGSVALDWATVMGYFMESD